MLAVVAEHQTGEHIALARCCSAVPLLPDLLHLIKDFQRDDCRMGVIENLAILHWILPLFVGSRVQHHFLFKQSGDLAWTFALHTECEDPFHNLRRFLINPS